MNKSEKIFFNILYFFCFFIGSILIYIYSNSGTMWGVLLIAMAVRIAVYIKENN